MKVVRTIAAIPLLALAGFCVFVFLASFEPGEFLVFRIGYPILCLGSLVAAAWLIFKRPAALISDSADEAD